MGSVNQAMWKKFGISANNHSVTSSVPHPVMSDQSLYFLADVPHLIKNLKQALLTHKRLFLLKEIVEAHNLPSNYVSVDHVADLLEFQRNKDLKLAPKLTDVILDPGQFDKMKVSHAMHLFSRAVSAGLRFMVEKEGRDKAYLTTAWFVDLMNTWFDLMSSRHPVMALSKANQEAYRSALSHLAKVINVLSKMSFDPQSRWKPVQTGIKVSTTSVLDLAEEILQKQPYLLTSRLSQDCLENLFSSVRLRGPTPSVIEFRNILKLLTVSQYLKSNEKGNYELDDREYLADFLATDISQLPAKEETDDIEEHANLNGKQLGEDEEGSLYYLVGYCIRSLKRTRQLQCAECYMGVTTTNPPRDVGLLTLLKEYKEGKLCHPSQQSYEACRVAEDVVCAAETTIIGKRDIVNVLTRATMSRITKPASDVCHQYVSVIVKKYISLRVKILCKKLTSGLKKEKDVLSSKSVAMRAMVKSINKSKRKN